MALADLYKVERLKDRFHVDMNLWHCPEINDSGKKSCAICLAGAVIAQTLKANDTNYILPCDYPESTENRLEALDCFRVGNVDIGFSIMDLDYDNGKKFNREIVKYYEDSAKFKRQMRTLANTLANNGY